MLSLASYSPAFVSIYQDQMCCLTTAVSGAGPRALKSQQRRPTGAHSTALVSHSAPETAQCPRRKTHSAGKTAKTKTGYQRLALKVLYAGAEPCSEIWRK